MTNETKLNWQLWYIATGTSQGKDEHMVSKTHAMRTTFHEMSLEQNYGSI